MGAPMLLSDERFAGYTFDACEDQQQAIDVSAENITIFVNNTVTPRGARTCKCVMFGVGVHNFTVRHDVIANTGLSVYRTSRYACYGNVTSSDCFPTNAVRFTQRVYRRTFLDIISPGFQIYIRDLTSRGVLLVVISIEFHLMPTISKYSSCCNFVVNLADVFKIC